MRNLLQLLLCACAALFFLSACDDKYSSGPADVEILDKVFTIPADWHYWRYGQLETDEGQRYQQLWFAVDINSFENIKPDYTKPNDLHIEIRPLRAEFGEKYYWTAQDPVYKTEPYNCKKYIHNKTEYELCEHGDKVMLASWARDNYSIRNKKTSEYITMFGCTKQPRENSSLNRVCNARTRFLDNLQIEYNYSYEYFDKAAELDRKINHFILSILKSQTSQESAP